jgi:hypothetical protein
VTMASTRPLVLVISPKVVPAPKVSQAAIGRTVQAAA